MSDVEIPSQYRVRVKQRLRVLAYAKEHGLKPAARHFALSRTTVREWRDRRDAQGPTGLLPRYPKRRRRRVAPELIPLIKQARSNTGSALIARGSGCRGFTGYRSPRKPFSGCSVTLG